MMRSAARGRAGGFTAAWGAAWAAACTGAASGFAALADCAGSAARYGSPSCGARVGRAAPSHLTPRLWGTPGSLLGVAGAGGAVEGVAAGKVVAGGDAGADAEVSLGSMESLLAAGASAVPAAGSAYSPYCGRGRVSCSDVTLRSPTFRRCRAAVLPRRCARPSRSQRPCRRRGGRTASCCRLRRRSSARRRSF